MSDLRTLFCEFLTLWYQNCLRTDGESSKGIVRDIRAWLRTVDGGRWTFEDYCLTRQVTYETIWASEVANNVSSNLQNTPSKTKALALKELDPEQQKEVASKTAYDYIKGHLKGSPEGVQGRPAVRLMTNTPLRQSVSDMAEGHDDRRSAVVASRECYLQTKPICSLGH